MILDHHRVDDSGQPGAERKPRAGIQPGRYQRGLLILASALVEKSLQRWGHQRPGGWPPPWQERSPDFKHPLAHVNKGYDHISPVYLAEVRHGRDGTGIVHSAPAYGVDDFNSCVSNGLAYNDILTPCKAMACSTRPTFRHCLAASRSGRPCR